MKTVIIADIHDNLVNLEKCLDWCKKNNVNSIVCCGDITNSETLGYLANSFGGAIFLIRGNMDIYEESEIGKHKNIVYLGRFGMTDIAEKKIGICHEPDFIKKLLEKEKVNIIFFGHTHKPWIALRKPKASPNQDFDKNEEVELINPGTLGGVFQKATFAVWEGEKIELKILELL